MNRAQLTDKHDTNMNTTNTPSARKIANVEIVSDREVLHRSEDWARGHVVGRVQQVRVTFTDGTSLVNVVRFWYDSNGNVVRLTDDLGVK